MRHEKPQPCKHVELQVYICSQLIIYQDSQNYDSFDNLKICSKSDNSQVALRGLPLLAAAAALGCTLTLAASELPWGGSAFT